ncbi:hypothetical protein M9H77_02695 [Catharanthus roseus]|uniref:Uncharacterized protein n=1 Tax=Catharanthus roseus TaxID=4058 RepID=A0ACC0C9B2_CATRO|nr:hypothetical protein M9H77_02695 [Catharanthus roseus]
MVGSRHIIAREDKDLPSTVGPDFSNTYAKFRAASPRDTNCPIMSLMTQFGISRKVSKSAIQVISEFLVVLSIRGLHCAWLVLRAKASSNDVDGFRLWMVDPLERGCSIIKGSAQLVVCLTLHHALHWDGHLVENQEGLEAKVGLKAELLESSR